MNSSKHVPPGWPAVIPRLFVENPISMVGFLKSVFRATGEYHEGRPSELRIGDSLIMVGGTVERMPSASFIYVYVESVDESYERAMSLGSNSIEEPMEMAYGDRRAMIEDPWGNHWQIATHRGFSVDV